MQDVTSYPVPSKALHLSGPVDRIEPGTLPLRGDLAHIALADRYIVTHYAVPKLCTIGSSGAVLYCHDNAQSDTLATLPAGSPFELLDQSGEWIWGCVSLEGPSGWIISSALSISE